MKYVCIHKYVVSEDRVSFRAYFMYIRLNSNI